MQNTKRKHNLGRRRALRVRKALRQALAKTERRDIARPRLSVIKTNKHLHAQLIDDAKGHTLAACSTASKSSKEGGIGSKSKENARKLGESFGKVLKEKKVDRLVFDRGSRKYHGVLAAFADGLRESGLTF